MSLRILHRFEYFTTNVQSASWKMGYHLVKVDSELRREFFHVQDRFVLMQSEVRTFTEHLHDDIS